MSQYELPAALPPGMEDLIDPNNGFLCMTSHWQPDPDAADPEMPGTKLTMTSYIPVFRDEACLCGSGRSYAGCCRLKRLWHPVCPNPGAKGYSLVEPQAATFRNIDGDALRERLMADRRLRCTDKSPDNAFWILHGHPPVEERVGILCFGDLELKYNRTLVASAMSSTRLQTLLALLREIAGDLLGKPYMRQDPALALDKRTGKAKTVKSSGPSSPKQRRRRRWR